jgi:hypothetical protein
VGYDYADLFDLIIATVLADAPFGERVESLIDYCSDQVPHPEWSDLRAVDYDGDLPRLDSWLCTALSESTREVVGLWFGLNNPVVSNKPTADLYVATSSGFSAGTVSWTQHVEFLPSGALNSEVLSAIYRVAYSDNSLGNDAEYPLALAYGAMAARSALEALDLRSVPMLRGAAIGFDSGDLMFLGAVDGGRFRVEVTPG